MIAEISSSCRTLQNKLISQAAALSAFGRKRENKEVIGKSEAVGKEDFDLCVKGKDLEGIR